MSSIRVCQFPAERRSKRRQSVRGLALSCLAAIAAFGLIVSPLTSHAQQAIASLNAGTLNDASNLVEPGVTSPTLNPVVTSPLQEMVSPSEPAPSKQRGNRFVNWFKRPVETELAVEGLASFGHYKIFATDYYEKLYTGGVEYDRHSWGTFLGARMDYVAEILPLTLLNQPANPGLWGQPLSTARTTLPGLSISPIGLRMMWWGPEIVQARMFF